MAQPFDLALDLAAFGDRKNLAVSGTAGPIVKDGAIDAGAIPINLDATVGPLTLAGLKSIPQLATALPRALVLSGEIKLQAKVTGTVDAISFDASSDLGSNRVAYVPSFDKPAGTTFEFTARGARTAGKVIVQQANLTLADLKANLTDIILAAGKVSARVDTNKFELGPIAQLIAGARPYNPTGAAEIHTAISLANSKPTLNGTITFVDVNAAMPGTSVSRGRTAVRALAPCVVTAASALEIQSPVYFDRTADSWLPIFQISLPYFISPENLPISGHVQDP